MATQGRNGKIKGKINNIVYRGYRDKQVLQIAPARVRQTYATKLNALEFGLASAQAKMLRRILRNFYDVYDGKMPVRLNAAVAECMRTSAKEIGDRTLHDADLGPLIGFQFNTAAPMEKLVRIRPKIAVAPNGQIKFTLPPFNPMKDIVYPPEPPRMDPSFMIVVTAFHFPEEYVHIVDHAHFDFENIDTVAEINWTCRRQLPKGSIVLITIALRYAATNWVGQRAMTKSTAFYPTIIVDAFHVTDDMAAEGVADGLEPPKRVMQFGDNVNDLLQKIARFKEKMAAKRDDPIDDEMPATSISAGADVGQPRPHQ